jgi:hypothetical protein
LFPVVDPDAAKTAIAVEKELWPIGHRSSLVRLVKNGRVLLIFINAAARGTEMIESKRTMAATPIRRVRL